jgi:excinuclease UvrABC nuclease subunit
MSRWKDYQLYPSKDKVFPDAPCVYAIYFDGDLVYVGQTTSLSNRFGGHAFRYSYGKSIITPWQEVPSDTRITIKASGSLRLGDWAMREIRLIRRLKPIFNTHHKNKRRSQK